MATLVEILDEWDKDSSINEAELGHEATRNPMIHAKYVRMISQTKLSLRKAESDYLTVRKTKWRYYRGEMGKAELDELGWNQYQGRIPTKSDMDEFLNCDPDLIRYTDKIQYFTVVKETLDSILKELNSRTWNIKTAVDYAKMMNGIN
jgi:hypothetical protein